MTAEAAAFATFAAAYPHEAYETWPDRFWAYFQRVRPGVSRETMERVLRETATKGAEGMSKVRLYRVAIEEEYRYDVLVVAGSADEAREVAEEMAGEERETQDVEPDFYARVSPIDTPEKVPAVWRDAFPYMPDGWASAPAHKLAGDWFSLDEEGEPVGPTDTELEQEMGP